MTIPQEQKTDPASSTTTRSFEMFPVRLQQSDWISLTIKPSVADMNAAQISNVSIFHTAMAMYILIYNTVSFSADTVINTTCRPII